MSAASSPRSLTAQRKAIITETLGKVVMSEVPIPKVGPKNALIRTTAVAFNPIDQFCVDWFSSAGCVVGCDFAGVVEAIGDSVKQDLKLGDRVCGFVHGCKSDAMDVMSQLFASDEQTKTFSHEHGAFATHVIATGDLCMKIPPSLSDVEAATLPVGLTTAGTALYYMMKFPFPDNPLPRRKPIFVYGGSTATGSYVIQLAKLSGCQVITTCSPHNFDYVKSLGADLVFDYHSPTLAADVRRACPMISNIIDCVSEDEQGTPEICAKIMCLAGGTYVPMLPVANPRDDVSKPIIATFSVFGEKFTLGPLDIPSMPDHHEWTKKWYLMAIKLVADGKVKPHRVKVMGGGLEGVIKAIEDYRNGIRLSGYKAVYRVES